MQLFKRWRRSRSDEQVESAQPGQSIMTPAAAPQVAPGISSNRSRRPATMGRTSAEQAYLAQAAHRAKHE